MEQMQATAREGETLRVNPPYTVRRSVHGELRVETHVDLPQLSEGADGKKWDLSISTSKASRGGISTFATVSHTKDGFRTMDLFGDFSRTIAKAEARGTEKALRTLHEQALAQVPALIPEIEAFYVTKRAKAKARAA